MTVTVDSPAHILWGRSIATFVRHGWTQDQWLDLHTFFTGKDTASGGNGVTVWLQYPPAEFATPITPARVRDLFTQYGRSTNEVLQVIGDGGTERFCAAFLGSQRNNDDNIGVVGGWRLACDLNLSEPQAVGWAATDYLGNVDYQDIAAGDPEWADLDDENGSEDVPSLAQTWTDQFGPDAWRYVLAGIDLVEATAMQENGTSPTEQQLRVMVALAGHTLPAGV